MTFTKKGKIFYHWGGKITFIRYFCGLGKERKRSILATHFHLLLKIARETCQCTRVQKS